MMDLRLCDHEKIFCDHKYRLFTRSAEIGGEFG
jgi:hypothetical protein